MFPSYPLPPSLVQNFAWGDGGMGIPTREISLTRVVTFEKEGAPEKQICFTRVVSPFSSLHLEREQNILSLRVLSLQCILLP